MIQKFLRLTKKDNRGFTLVELMVVIIILGILVAIAIPTYTGMTATANAGAVKATLKVLDGGIATVKASNDTINALNVAKAVGWANAAGTAAAFPTTSPASVTYNVADDATYSTATIGANANVKGFASGDVVHLAADGSLTK